MDHNNDKYTPDAQPLTKAEMFYLSGKAKEFMERYMDTDIAEMEKSIQDEYERHCQLHQKNERP